MRLSQPVAAGFFLLIGASQCQTTPPVVTFHTNLGDINVQLLANSAPHTVANFLSYVNAGSYTNSIVHRSVPGFIWQGGGYQLINSNPVAIPANAPIQNEFAVSNTAGTLAMALLNGDINSATTQWFFNEVDNAGSLDPQFFAVFGRIMPSDTASMTVLDTIAVVATFNLGGVFDQIPLQNYSGGMVQDSNLVLVNSITAATGGPAPIGVIDTPANNTTNVAGAIGVTGWALSYFGVASLGIYREPLPGEPTQSNGLVFVGNATFIPGSRPDVATAYPSYPNGAAAGWGFQVLTNELPGTNGQPIGNGSYKLHAIATDAAGSITDLGTVAITVNNAASVLPFGTIDTPTQGGTASGKAFVNFGWVLTPQPDTIPLNGSTITVYIDGVPKGHPIYNNPRSDIETLFPGYQNTNGAIGYLKIDTTELTNGLHTISWGVKDNAGHSTGIGSRFFIVQN